jgi:hypothetical protein
VLLTGRAYKRVAWNKPLHAYFNSNFRKVTSVPIGDVLYVRNDVRLR